MAVHLFTLGVCLLRDSLVGNIHCIKLMRKRSVVFMARHWTAADDRSNCPLHASFPRYRQKHFSTKANFYALLDGDLFFVSSQCIQSWRQAYTAPRCGLASTVKQNRLVKYYRQLVVQKFSNLGRFCSKNL